MLMLRAVVLVTFIIFPIHRAFASDDMEDFPLDSEGGKIDEEAQPPDDSNVEFSNDNTDRIDLNGLTSANNRIALFNKVMLVAMKKPGAKQRIAQVLPIIRSMSPSQRLTLATLVLNQLMAKSQQPTYDSVNSADNKTAELMIPISADIASIFHGLSKDGESARSTNFGTYYYNPLSAGYRVSGPQPQRPPLYNIRRFPFANSRRKDDVPPEMMPPPYSPSGNVSYVNYNKGSSPNDLENEGEFTKAEENDEVADDEEAEEDSEGDGSDNQMSTSKECIPFISNLCLDVSYYPNRDIVTSIKNLEQKHVFRALLEDSVTNVTVDNPEIDRRYGNEDNQNLQLCSSKVKYARPKKAKSLNGNWKYVVNTEQYTQTVRIETCLNADKTCSYVSGDVKSRCSQIYNYHRLLTWDEKSGLSLDLFKIPTCCACQLQNISPFTSTKKLSLKPDAGIQENVIAEEPSVFLAAATKPGIRHQKPKLKPNVQYNPKRESFNRPRRPPTILPLHHEATEYQVPVRYSPNDNAIRRASVKNNPVKGVYVPGKGTYVENPETESTTPSHRVNYNYHPIIDFFRSTPSVSIDRSDSVDDWLPMTEGPRSMP